MTRLIFLLPIFMAFVVPEEANAQEQSACDPAYVVFDGVRHLITPGADDDGVNIQCAVDEATDFGTGKVSLMDGTFRSLQPIWFENFEGVFEGRTKASTILEFDMTQSTEGLRIESGRPVIRYMTIRAIDAADGSPLMLLTPLQSDCSRRVVRLEIDRVILDGNGSSPSGVISDTRACSNPIQGTVLVNRSDLIGLSSALNLSMSGGARVDVYFSALEADGYCFASLDANQSLNFIGNSCVSELGVGVYGAPPAPTTLQLSSNTFATRLRDERTPVAVSSAGDVPSSVVSMVRIDAVGASSTIANNQFDAGSIVGTTVTPVYVKGESAIHGNTFTGPATSNSPGIVTLASPSANIGSAVYGNVFNETPAFSAVYLESGSHIVKQSQAVVVDLTDDSLIGAFVSTTPYTGAEITSGGIDTGKFSSATSASITSINGFYFQGSRFSNTVFNNTGQVVQVGSIQFFIGGELAGSTTGEAFLTGGVLENGGSIGVTLTLNSSNFSGVVTAIYEMSYQSEDFTREFVVYDPDSGLPF